MTKLHIIQDTINFAREIAFEVELRPDPPSQDQILAALEVMDAQLKDSGENIRSMFGFEAAFLIPDHPLEVELMEEDEYASSVVPASVVKARLDHFEWTDSVTNTGFGLRLFGVDFIEPKRKHATTAFVPLYALDIRLSV
ncbi:MAG: hypothetical protein ACI9T8_000467 [Candidatus Saccharimonadales bacterium]|jgi:hypothetical protein